MSNRLTFHVRKGDTVKVTTGNHKGATGKILAVLPKKSQVLIEDLAKEFAGMRRRAIERCAGVLGNWRVREPKVRTISLQLGVPEKGVNATCRGIEL